jgi:hypothetical protein
MDKKILLDEYTEERYILLHVDRIVLVRIEKNFLIQKILI